MGKKGEAQKPVNDKYRDGFDIIWKKDVPKNA
jgi:hypothetical protein